MAEKKRKKYRVSIKENFRRKFGRNRAVLNESDPGNDKYKRSNINVVQK